jgi:hypothetical protein
MSSTYESHEGETLVKVSVKLDAFRLTDNLLVMRTRNSHRIKSHTGMKTPGIAHATNICGFIDQENFTARLAGKPFKMRDRLHVVRAETIEAFRTDGFMRTLKDDSWKVGTDPFTAMTSGDFTVNNVVQIDAGNYLVSDHAGNPLPVAITFDYMKGFDERHYDLERAAAHLLTRKDVLLARNPPRGATYAETNQGEFVAAKSAKEAIHNIPSYNAEAGRQYHIAFRWMPSAEDYRKLATKARLGHSLDYAVAVFDLDLLGLRAAGAARGKTFYEKSGVGSDDED